MHKKFKSKWFVVATEGATTDGRAIQRVWIEQMAKNYNPKTYGARINLDHIKFFYYDKNQPHSQAYGDVIALKAEENSDGKLQLLAQLDPTEALIELNKNRQKIYTSIEVDPNFADTGEAYLVGLAVTDDPASLGTEMLQFASGANHNPLLNRKTRAENLFSEAIEAVISFEEVQPKESLLAKVKQLLSKKADSQTTEAQLSEVEKSVEFVAENLQSLQQHQSEQASQIEQLTAQISELTQTVETLSRQPLVAYTPPVATGNEGKAEASYF